MATEEMKKRIVSEQECAKRITNNDLICKDCKFMYVDTVELGNTSMCEKFNVKPVKVLLGGDCDEHETQE